MSTSSDYSESGRWYAYSCAPIDYWPLWVNVADLIDQPGRLINDRWASPTLGPEPAFAADQYADELTRFATALREVVVEAKAIGWEGDGEWKCSSLPVPGDQSNATALIFGIKQQNNGTTFIVSPFPLPWFE